MAAIKPVSIVFSVTRYAIKVNDVTASFISDQKNSVPATKDKARDNYDKPSFSIDCQISRVAMQQASFQ